LTDTPSHLALFPLHTVLFPGGLLSLRVFEPRYIDLISKCHINHRPFGAIALQTANSALSSPPQKQNTETVGVRAELIDIAPDSIHPGVLRVRCKGLDRFAILSSSTCEGAQEARVQLLPPDNPPTREFLHTVQALAIGIGALKERGAAPFLTPYDFDNAGWVANRWCELLPLSLKAKQRLMELTDPSIRLKLVDQFLRSNGVVKAA
jgi:Lon protease-like protein